MMFLALDLRMVLKELPGQSRVWRRLVETEGVGTIMCLQQGDVLSVYGSLLFCNTI